MKMSTVITAAVAGAFVTFAGTAVADEGLDMAGKYKCTACHTVDKKLVGPSFKDVAKKYATDKTAADSLAVKIKAGSKGVWGPMAMPKNDVPDADAKKLAVWILSIK